MAAALQLEIQGLDGSAESHPLEFGAYPIGSEKGSKILIADHSVDRRHAILIVHRDGLWVEDLNSQSGTFIAGQPVQGRARLQPGQKISLGNYTLVISSTAAPASAAAAPPASSEPAPQLDAPAPADRPAAQRQQKLQLKKQIHEELLMRLDIKRLTATHVKEAELHERARSTLELIVADVRNRLPGWVDPQLLIKEIYDEAVGLGPLEDLLADPEITERFTERDEVKGEKP